MTTLSATRARIDFFDLIKSSIKQHKTFRINHRSGNVMLMSEDDYDSLIETIELLSSPNFRKKYKKAKDEIAKKQTLNFEEVFGEKQ